MTWTWAGTTLDREDEPDQRTRYPEGQRGIHVKHHPLGLGTANSTILTYKGSHSLEGRFRFLCSETMRDLLISLERTTFTVVDVWGVSRDWYLERLDIAHPVWSGTATARYDIAAYMVGR